MGCPSCPPELSRVQAMLEWATQPPEAVIAEHPATGLQLTVQAAAVNAVMAGCLPEYFPILVAAFEAMNERPYNFHGSTASTGGSAPLLIVSGPIVDEIGMNAGVNLFGPGNRANATIGRAVRLIILNVFRMAPGIADKSTQGHPGKYGSCIAERADVNPWPSLRDDLGYPDGVSSVTVYAAAGFVNVENHGGNRPEQVLDAVADAMANYGSISIGQSVVCCHPSTLASWRAPAGARPACRTTCSRRPCDRSPGCSASASTSSGSGALQGLEAMHRGLTPQDILVTVGGGDAAAIPRSSPRGAARGGRSCSRSRSGCALIASALRRRRRS